MCGGDPALVKYFYDWIAKTMQPPDEPAGSALVLRGEKGTGKGTIGHFLRDCLETPILCQAPQHNAGHGDVNPGFIRPGEALIAFTQSA